jgi:hypothetical protein
MYEIAADGVSYSGPPRKKDTVLLVVGSRKDVLVRREGRREGGREGHGAGGGREQERRAGKEGGKEGGREGGREGD